MKRQSILVVTMIIVLFGVGNAEGDFFTLDAPEAIETYADHIDGSYIVGSYEDATGFHGFLYDKDKTPPTWTTIDVSEASHTEVHGIDDPNIVGYYQDALGFHHGFLYNRTTSNWTMLNKLGASNTYVYGIDGNNIVGYYQDALGFHHGFLYDKDKTPPTWMPLDKPGATGTYVMSIDGSNIVGFYEDPDGFHGFLYDGTTWTTIEMGSDIDTYVYDIDGSTLLVGGYFDPSRRGYLYDMTTWTSIDVPGATETVVRCINGMTIAGSYRAGSNDKYHGFVGVVPASNSAPVADAGPDQTVECACQTAEGTKVTLDGSGSDDPDGDPLTYTWTGPFVESPLSGNNPTPTLTLLPGCLGTYPISLVVNDGSVNSEPDTVQITVVDTTPPTINSISASPDVLWPPNYTMVEVTVTVDCEDICDPAPFCYIVGVTINGPGDGNTEPDWEFTDDPLVVLLRAERAGAGTGRVYTIHIECMDASGNIAEAIVDVTVPHDQGKGKK